MGVSAWEWWDQLGEDDKKERMKKTIIPPQYKATWNDLRDNKDKWKDTGATWMGYLVVAKQDFKLSWAQVFKVWESSNDDYQDFQKRIKSHKRNE